MKFNGEDCQEFNGLNRNPTFLEFSTNNNGDGLEPKVMAVKPSSNAIAKRSENKGKTIVILLPDTGAWVI